MVLGAYRPKPAGANSVAQSTQMSLLDAFSRQDSRWRLGMRAGASPC